MDQEKELEETFIEEFESACLLEKGEKYKATTILLSKALFALVDYLIVQKYHKLPKNHAERFRILESREPALYRLVDEVWSKYTDTYTKPTAQASIELLKETIQEVCKENESISEAIKKRIKKTS